MHKFLIFFLNLFVEIVFILSNSFSCKFVLEPYILYQIFFLYLNDNSIYSKKLQ